MSTMKRQLSHALIYDKKSNRWQCACGYKLGDGHHTLYALCPLSHRDKAVNAARRKREVVWPSGKRARPPASYLENEITSQPAKVNTQELLDI